MSDAARHEALGMKWNLDPSDVAPHMGQENAYWWGELITKADPAIIIHQLSYRIEAGSIRKPNREADRQKMNDGMQTLGPILQGWAQATGDPTSLNALLEDWCKANDLDPSRYMLPPPPPPMPPPGAPPGGQPQGPPQGVPA
jgi:hypothetical protein